MEGGCLKILITSDFYVPTINGVVTSVLNLKRGLEERGHEVRVLTLCQNKKEKKEEGVWYLPSVGAGFIYPTVRVRFGFYGKTYREILRWGPDIVHSQCEFSTYGAARRIAAALRIPLIDTYHTVYEEYAHYLLPFGRKICAYAAKKFTQKQLKKADAVIAPSAKIYDLLVKYGIKKDIYVLPSGLDLQRFRGKHVGEQIAGRINSFANGRKKLLFLGRLAEEKNVEELIEYVGRLRREDIVLLIAGDGPFRKTLEECAGGLRDRVCFLGMIPSESVPACLAAADLFVCASTSETQGLTYIESLACGIPLLCREDACLRGVVVEGVNGWLYTDYRSFKDKLEQFLVRSDVQGMARQCRLSVQKYSLDVFAKRAEEMYLQCCLKKRNSKVELCENF